MTSNESYSKYSCPVCKTYMPSLNEKKAHIRSDHPKE